MLQFKVKYIRTTECLQNDKSIVTHAKSLSHGILRSKRNNNTISFNKQMSRLMRKPTICICENKDADQLHGNREADQRLSFRYTDSTIPLLSKSEISSL